MRRLLILTLLCLVLTGIVSAGAEMPVAEDLPVPDDLPAENEITITAGGDVTFGGDWKTNGHKDFEAAVKQHGIEWFLSDLAPLFSEDDLTLVNLECPLTNETKLRKGRPFNFKGDPSWVAGLTSASIEVCGLSNNHTLDFGEEGYRETEGVLSESGIGSCGFGTAYQTEVNGIRVCVIAVSQWYDSVKEVKALIKKARSVSDLVLVMIHWGTEKQYSATKKQKEYGHAAVDAGADLVIGSHTHVVGGIEAYKGKYILYSTGNLCFGGSTSPYDMDCMLFRQSFRLTEKGIESTGITVYPCSVSTRTKSNDYHPRLLSGSDAERVIKKIRKHSSADKADAALDQALTWSE